jgi:quercetin dioxygenase-like cupin family protein
MGEAEFLGGDLGAGVSVIVVDAAPGDRVRLHTHPYREVFVILEGESTFTLGDEQHVHHAGEVVVALAGTPHGFVNSGAGRLRQVDIHENDYFITDWLE